MRKLIGLTLLFLWSPQAKETKPQMVIPKVTHHDMQSVQHYDRVTITCPEGYEGHFVDINIGFDGQFVAMSQFGGTISFAQPGYTVCFSKEFMDDVRKNPDLFRPRPEPPKPV